MLMLIKNGDLSPLRNLLKFTIPPLEILFSAPDKKTFFIEIFSKKLNFFNYSPFQKQSESK